MTECIDYKELIKKLKKKDECNCECLESATAIETLLAERDSAVFALKLMIDSCRICERTGHKL